MSRANCVDAEDLVRAEAEHGGPPAWHAQRAAGATKLGYLQWLLLRTDAFKQWPSAWTDREDDAPRPWLSDPDTGEPAVMFHGTEVMFNAPDAGLMGSQQGRGCQAFWLTSSAENAGFYGPIVRQAFVSLGRTRDMASELAGDGAPRRWAQDARRQGLDSVVLRDIVDGSHPSDICAVFSPRQVLFTDCMVVDGVVRPMFNSDGQPIHPTAQGVRNFWRWFGQSRGVDQGGRPLTFYHATSFDFAEFESRSLAQVMYQDGCELQRADSWDMGEDGRGAPHAYHYMALSDQAVLGPLEALKARQDELDGLKARNPGQSFPDSERLVRDLQRLSQGGPIVTRQEYRPSGVAPYFSPDRQYGFIRNAHQLASAFVMPVYLRMNNPVRLDVAAIESAGWRSQKYVDQGHDAAVFAADADDLLLPDGMGNRTQAVVFDKTSIRSSLGNAGSFDGSKSDIRFSSAVGLRADVHGAMPPDDLFEVLGRLERLRGEAQRWLSGGMDGHHAEDSWGAPRQGHCHA